MAAIPFHREIHYPESDGRPMGETDLHISVMIDLLTALRNRYEGEPDVYLAADLFLYYVEGDPRAVVAPDVLLVRGVPKAPKRRTFLLWNEGQAPCFVIEVTSKSTRGEDLETKKKVYEMLGVEEYFLFDPLGEYLEPRLQGFRIARGRYDRIAPAPDGALASRTTGLRLRPEGENLRLVDAATGERLLWVEELDAARRRAQEQARAADERTRKLEEELARLKRELGRE
jgi:Uma2 family endonuclease